MYSPLINLIAFFPERKFLFRTEKIDAVFILQKPQIVGTADHAPDGIRLAAGGGCFGAEILRGRRGGFGAKILAARRFLHDAETLSGFCDLSNIEIGDLPKDHR